jgi:hypothetical protein
MLALIDMELGCCFEDAMKHPLELSREFAIRDNASTMHARRPPHTFAGHDKLYSEP